MKKVLLQIIENALEPVSFVTNEINIIVNELQQLTNKRIYFKHAEITYYTEAGHLRKRKCRNRFEVWIMQDMYELQERELNQLQQWQKIQ